VPISGGIPDIGVFPEYIGGGNGDDLLVRVFRAEFLAEATGDCGIAVFVEICDLLNPPGRGGMFDQGLAKYYFE
jgi:hypothetical protein